MRKLDDFDKGFPNGVFADAGKEEIPRINMRSLSLYCSKQGIKPKELTNKEMQKFILNDE